MIQTVWTEFFEAYAQKVLDDAKVPGVVVALAEQGNPVYLKAFGQADVEAGVEITEHSLFGIGSVTKSFTCVAIMQLQEQGKLSVHDPVQKYLPEFRVKEVERAQKMTIHHFMTHSAGLPPLATLAYAMKSSSNHDPAFHDFFGFDLDEHDAIDNIEQLMAYIASLDLKMLGEPGTEFSYSNDSYALLGTIVERVSGQTYEQYVQEHILDPAGMSDSVFLPEVVEQRAEAVKLYTQKKQNGEQQVFPSPIWWDAPSMRSAGFLKSSANDMLRYAEIFRNGGKVGQAQILSPTSVEQMVGLHVPMDAGKWYGYGFMVDPSYHGVTLIEHGGALKGVSAQLFIVPELAITGMIMANLDGAPVKDVMVSLLNGLLDRPVDADERVYADYPLSAEAIEEYVGNYVSQEGSSMSVGVEEGQLVVMVSPSGNKATLQAIGKDQFVVAKKGSVQAVRFVRDESGEVCRIFFGVRQVAKAITSRKMVSE